MIEMMRLPPDIRDKREALHRRAQALGFRCYARKGIIPAQLKHVLRVTETDDAFLSRDYIPARGPDITEDLNTKGVREDRERRYNELYREYIRAELAGKKFKIWRTEHDRKVRESHTRVDGIAVPINDRFQVGGEELLLPCDPSASFEETANCRCDVEFVEELPEDAQERLSECQKIAVEIGNAELQIERSNRKARERANEISEESERVTKKVAGDENTSVLEFVLGAIAALQATTGVGALVIAATALIDRVADLIGQNDDIRESYDAKVQWRKDEIRRLHEFVKAKEEEINGLRGRRINLGCQLN